MSELKIAAIIPARMGSSRYPGKPLIKVHGLPMIEHVRRRTLLSKGFSDVVIATCDNEIKDCVESFGGKVIMTSPHHPGAMDRVLEAMEGLSCTHVVNVQGDEILILPENLDKLLSAMRASLHTEAWNAIARIEDRSDLTNRSVVKCFVSKSDKILFSVRDMSNVPFKENLEPARIILGILAFRREFLTNYKRLSRTPFETLEGIDQDRLLEHDFHLQGIEFSRGYPGINTPEDVILVERFLTTDPKQQKILETILATPALR